MRLYQEIIATNSLDPFGADDFVHEARVRSREFMRQRETEIEDGLVHLTYAMAENMRKLGELDGADANES